MPFNWNGDYIPSKADKTTDILGSKEIGGIGQLIYHPFRFASYDISYDGKDYCACPVDNESSEGTISELSLRLLILNLEPCILLKFKPK